jgi:tRNA (mo5U34)-methyltransferase
MTQDWDSAKARAKKETQWFEKNRLTARISEPVPAMKDHLMANTRAFMEHQINAEPYWFQRIEVMPGVFSPGWSDPQTEKLPYYGLPEDLTGKRVLDIGCAEGFFSFEAEQRGAKEVIAIDSFPDSVRRFNIVRSARQSNASAYLTNVYDLDKKKFGTFDLVLFYGVFYHLKHPQLALEKIRDVCSGQLLFQTHVYEEPALTGVPWAKYHPYGIMSGRENENYDPTVFWLFNAACCVAMLEHVGFEDIRIISQDPAPFVISARSPVTEPGCPPNQVEAPWC